MKSVKVNYIYSLMYQLLAIIAPLITAPYISRVLNVSDIGIYSYTQSVVFNYILFGTIGLTVYGQREIASITAKKKDVSECFSELLYLRIILMSASIVVFFFCCVLNGNYSVAYSIELMQLFSAMLDIAFLFQGLEEFKKIALRNGIVKILNIVLIFSLVRSSDDLNWYIFCCAIGSIVSCVIIWVSKPKDVHLIKVPVKSIFAHLIPAIALFIPQVAVEVYTVLDKTMLGMLTEKAESGYYEQANKIIKILLTIVTSLGTVMLSRVSKLLGENAHDRVNTYIYKSFSFVFCISIPIAVGLALISHDFIPMYFGPGYERSADLVVIMCPISILIGMSSVCGTQYLIPAKRQKDYTINVSTGAVVNLIINLLLIPHFGCIGAAIASLTAETAVLSRHLYSIRKDFSILKILSLSKKYIIAACCMSLVVVILGKGLPHGMTGLIIKVVGGALAYVIMLLINKDEIVYDTMVKLKSKITK